MDNNIYKSIRPLKILSSVWGFYTAVFQPTKEQRLLKIYSWTAVVVCAVVSVVTTLTKLYVLNFSYVSVARLLKYVIRTIDLILYRVNFIVRADSYRRVLENINYVDESL